MQAKQQDTMLDHALRYAAMGFRVLPLTGNRIPFAKPGVHAATTTESRIREFWAAHPGANIGIACGLNPSTPDEFKPSWKLCVVDIDPRNDGVRGWTKILQDNLATLPTTLRVRTGRGGTHLYFLVPSNLKIPKGLCGGVDTKGDGGYVVAPPSSHEAGEPYVWDDIAPDTTSVARAPDWLINLIREKGVKANTPTSPVDVTFIDGGRDNALASLAGTMRRRGMDGDEIYAALTVVNNKRCRPPKDDEDVRRVAYGSERYAPDDPVDGGEAVVQSIAIKSFDAEAMSKPLPPIHWLSKELRLSKGPVVMFAGEPGSGKTLGIQHAMVAMAAGKDMWGAFSTKRCRVAHFDYEQGEYISITRFQQSAAGLDVDWRDLIEHKSIVSHIMPQIYMTDAKDEEKWCKALEGYEFALIDSYTRCCRVKDENAPEAARPLESWWRVSEKTGCAIGMIHHFNKDMGHSGKKRKLKDRVRGSSAIIAMTAEAWGVERDDASGAPSSWHHFRTRVPGASVEPFQLDAEWSPVGDDPFGALKFRPKELGVAEMRQREAKYEEKLKKVLELVRISPGLSARKYAVSFDCSKSQITEDLLELENRGKVCFLPGPRNGKLWRAT